MKAGEKYFLLTPKGIEELHGRAQKLDANTRNVLSLIDQGFTSADAILQRSKSSRDELIDMLRLLLSNGFVATATSDGSAKAATPEPTPSVADSISERLRLKSGISPSQGRFVLSNFCLDQFGTAGKDLADVVDLCVDVAGLQLALDSIRSEVKRVCPDRRPLLVACVREINETDFDG
ncbi:MAG: hypothetical protein M3N91_06605 [Pseudomonadota bacterium]|nr:hypothetical protein [Pseudomonadota bacterium]